MSTTQAVRLQQEPVIRLNWSGMMTGESVSGIADLLGILLVGKEITIVTADQEQGYMPKVYPKQTLFTFNSGKSFEITHERCSVDLLIAIQPVYITLHFTASKIYPDGTLQHPYNPHFTFCENQVTITWYSRLSKNQKKNYMVLSV